MPWTADDAPRFTRKADTPEKKEKWAAMANAVYGNTGDKSKAIRTANAAVRDYEETRVS